MLSHSALVLVGKQIFSSTRARERKSAHQNWPNQNHKNVRAPFWLIFCPRFSCQLLAFMVPCVYLIGNAINAIFTGEKQTKIIGVFFGVHLHCWTKQKSKTIFFFWNIERWKKAYFRLLLLLPFTFHIIEWPVAVSKTKNMNPKQKHTEKNGQCYLNTVNNAFYLRYRSPSIR